MFKHNLPNEQPVHINPDIKKDDLGRFGRPNEKCALHGLRNRGNITTNCWSGTTKRFRRLKCKVCGKTFTENYGTPFYGIKTDREKKVQALKMVVERGSMRGTLRAMGVDKDMICDWVKKASEYAEEFSEYMLHDHFYRTRAERQLGCRGRQARGSLGTLYHSARPWRICGTVQHWMTWPTTSFSAMIP